MSKLRFQVLPENQLTVWDAQEQKTIHLGSRVEAAELAELLNGLQDKIKAQSLVLLRQTGQINFLELEVARLTDELSSDDYSYGSFEELPLTINRSCDTCVRDSSKAIECRTCMYKSTKTKDHWIIRPSLKKKES